MKNFNRLFYLLLLMFSINHCLAITVNGRDLATLISPDGMLTYSIGNELDEVYKNIYISIKNGAIEIGSMRLRDVDDVKNFYRYLEEHKDELPGVISQEGASILKSNEGPVEIKDGYVFGGTEVILDAYKAISIDGAIIRSKEVAFIANKLKLHACFINADTLQIEPQNQNSIFKALVFKLDKTMSIPVGLGGKIDFLRDETETELLVVGATQVTIAFSDKVTASQ